MASFEALPQEILAAIWCALPLADQVRLSRTSRWLHDAVTPHLYRRLSVRNEARVASSAHIGATRYGSLVRELEFLVVAVPDRRYCVCGSVWRQPRCGNNGVAGTATAPANSVAALSLDETLPPSLAAILGSGRQLLPGPGAVRIVLRPPLPCRMPGHDASPARERFETVAVSVLRAVARNWSPARLAITNLSPGPHVAMDTEEWRRAGEKIESLQLALADHRTCDRRDYNRFLRQLSSRLFDRLPSIRHLKLRASLERYRSLPFSASSMPRLRELELKELYISRGLLEFLAARDRTTEPLSVTLREAFAMVNAHRDDGSDFTWEAFFSGLTERNAHIKRFTLPDRESVQEAWSSAYGGLMLPDADRRAARDKIAACPDAYVFSYAAGDGLSRDVEEAGIPVAFRRFVDGGDQASYDEFMSMVEAKRARFEVPGPRP